MALWKPLKGKRSDLDAVEKHDGWIYFTTDDASLFFDYVDTDGNLQRKQINGKDAETLCGKSLDEIQQHMSGSNPRLTTITIPAANWTGTTNPWSQVVTINGVTANSKVDLQPTATQIVALQNKEITLMLQNDSGVITAWAIGDKPTEDYTMQVLITEVTLV